MMNKRNAPAENHENAPRENAPQTKGLLDSLKTTIVEAPRASVQKLGTLLSEKVVAMRGVEPKDEREGAILATERNIVARRLELVRAMA